MHRRFDMVDNPVVNISIELGRAWDEVLLDWNKDSVSIISSQLS